MGVGLGGDLSDGVEKGVDYGGEDEGFGDVAVDAVGVRRLFIQFSDSEGD